MALTCLSLTILGFDLYGLVDLVSSFLPCCAPFFGQFFPIWPFSLLALLADDVWIHSTILIATIIVSTICRLWFYLSQLLHHLILYFSL